MADPILAKLESLRREHADGYDCSHGDSAGSPCTCGASTANATIDQLRALLAGDGLAEEAERLAAEYATASSMCGGDAGALLLRLAAALRLATAGAKAGAGVVEAPRVTGRYRARPEDHSPQSPTFAAIVVINDFDAAPPFKNGQLVEIAAVRALPEGAVMATIDDLPLSVATVDGELFRYVLVWDKRDLSKECFRVPAVWWHRQARRLGRGAGPRAAQARSREERESVMATCTNCGRPQSNILFVRAGKCSRHFHTSAAIGDCWRAQLVTAIGERDAALQRATAAEALTQAMHEDHEREKAARAAADARADALAEALEKAADTFRDTALAMRMLRRETIAQAMEIAEAASREVLAAVRPERKGGRR